MRRGDARPRGDRVTRQRNDLFILEALHRFGPQTTEAIYQLLYPLYRDRHSLKHRLKLLRHEDATSDYDGPLIFYPDQQRRGATLPDNNPTVYDILPRGERLLKNTGLWRQHHPRTKNKEWKHDFMRATILSSIAIPAKANHCEFIHYDEVLAPLDGKLPFSVPTYEYQPEKGGLKTRSNATLWPDGYFALRYDDGTKRIFLIEADCDTEPGRSDNLERKSHKHNILSYHTLLSDGDLRREYFGSARVGVLNVFSSPHAMKLAMAVHEEQIGSQGSYMLYQHWEAFGDYFRPPHPRPDLFLSSWQRVGQPPAFISKSSGEQPIPSSISKYDLLAVPAALSEV